jgi:hypothetical protein
MVFPDVPAFPVCLLHTYSISIAPGSFIDQRELNDRSWISTNAIRRIESHFTHPCGRCTNPEIASLALKSVRWILRRRPSLAIEIVDSEALSFVFNWRSSPLSRDQIDFFDSLFTTDDMTLIVVHKYDLLNRLHAIFETQSLSNEHRCQLFTIVVNFAESINGESTRNQRLLRTRFERMR